MSTKSTIWYGVDDKGRELHIYWELAERIPSRSAPMYLEIEADGNPVLRPLFSHAVQKRRANPPMWQCEHTRLSPSQTF